MRNLYAFLFICASLNMYAQQVKITGKLFNKNTLPISMASVLLKNQNNRIIVFSNTNIKGEFSFNIADTLVTTGFLIEVNYLGYKKAQIVYSPNILNYNITLEETAIELKEVKIKNKPQLNSKGDTLSYNVNSFSQNQDKSIGDVLKRMPGIEILENGQISYNGKNISNMYIGGDDLLDGKYAIGTRTIPKDVIQSVDVMQHHQPIKVLQNKSFTDDVALNLVIKDDANLSLSGEAKLALGLPHQYDVELNAILFNKKIKMLNVLQGNNIGIDYRDDFQQFGYSNFLVSTGNTRPISIISAGTAGNPDLPHKNYYLNNSGMLNANNLYNYKNGLQVKSNIQTFIDRNRFNYKNITDYYLKNDTVNYTEIQEAIIKPFNFNGTFKVTVNKVKYFVNNDLKINYSNEDNDAFMTINNFNFSQELKNIVQDFSNNFRLIPSLGKNHILDINWYINYYNNPQQLYIDKGLNKDVLNSGINFSGINQRAATPTWFSNTTVRYSIPNYQIKQNYQLGIINEYQLLNSSLNLTSITNKIFPYLGDNGNDLVWRRNRAFFNAYYEWKKNNTEILLSLPINYQKINYNDLLNAQSNKIEHAFFNPSARLKYFTATEDYLQLNLNYNNNVGNVNGIYKGAILVNYRTFRSNDTQIQEETLSSASFFYNFQRSLLMLFINTGISYNRVLGNTIQSNVINNSIEQTIQLPFNNEINSWNAKFGISKYIFKLNSTASIKLLWTKNQFNQFFNGQNSPVNNTGLTINTSLDCKLFGKLNVNYTGTASWFKSSQFSLITALNTSIEHYTNNISLEYSPLKDVYATFKSRNISANQENINNINYFFFDANIRYKINRWKIDVEIDLSNLGNVKQYEIISLTNNKFSYNKYNIRGRMAIIRMNFYL